MKLDIDKTINALESDSIGIDERCIEDAIKVMRMWEWTKDVFGGRTTVYLHTDEVLVVDLMTKAEEKFFPSTVQRVLKAKFTISPHLAPCDLSKIRKVMESVSDVKVQEITIEEVVQSDKDC